ncbi:hypothetical protein ABPG72_022583 [Tetrahymena utriculariae]
MIQSLIIQFIKNFSFFNFLEEENTFINIFHNLSLQQMVDIVDDSMHNMPNIDIKEEEEADFNLNEAGNKKKLYSSDDSKDQNDNQNNILEPSILNIEATNGNIPESDILQQVNETMDIQQKENTSNSKDKKNGKEMSEANQIENQDDPDVESSQSKTTSDEDYQNPLEKGMVMEEYEDDDEFIGVEEEIPSTQLEQKKNSRKSNDRRGQRKKKIMESEEGDEEDSSNSSSGMTQKKNQNNQKRNTSTRTRRRRRQSNSINDSTFSEIKPQKRTRRRKVNIDESEIKFNNKEDNQLIQDAIDFINSKPRRRRTKKKENVKLDSEFLEKIQKKVKSNEKDVVNMQQVNLNQNCQGQQNGSLPQFVDLNKTISSEIQFQQINPQLIQQQLQFQNLAQLQLQAMHQLPFILQKQQQQQNQQQNGQLQAALANPLLLQNYQNQFLLQAQRNAELLINVKKEDLQSQPHLNLGLQQQNLEENKSLPKQINQPALQNSNSNQSNGRHRTGRRQRGSVQSNQANGKNSKEDESFTVDDLGRRKKYNTRKKIQKQNYAESPLNEEKDNEEGKTSEQKEKSGMKEQRNLEEVGNGIDESNLELIEKIQKKAEEKRLGKEIEQQLKDLLSKIENEKQNQILSQIVNKYHLNTDKIQDSQPPPPKQNSKIKEDVKKKGTTKEIILNPHQTLTQQLEVIDNLSVDSANGVNINYRESGSSDENLNQVKNVVDLDKEKEPKKPKQLQTSYKLLNYDKLEQKGNICTKGRQDSNKPAQPANNLEQTSQNEESNEEDDFIRDEVIPITGHFKYKDKAIGVLSSKILNKNIYLEIQWEKRKNGVTPTPTILNTHEVKVYDTDFLIEFYESKILKTNESKVLRQPNQQVSNSKNSHIEQLRQDVHKNQMQVSLQQRDKYYKFVEPKESQVLSQLDNQTTKSKNIENKTIINSQNNNTSNVKNQSNKKIDLNQQNDNESGDEEISQTDKNKIYQIDTPSSKSSEEFCIDPYRKFIEDEGLLPEQLQQELKEKLVF